VSRLHAENHGAHAWFTQIEGQRLFFLFSPEQASKLYEERGGYVDPVEGFMMPYTTTASPIDPFFPSPKKHPRFCEAAAHVALIGEGKTLVVQFTVKHEQNIDCGGGYVKIFPSDLEQTGMHGDSPYNIMFGPDICGPGTKKVHVIFNYKGKNLLVKKDIKFHVIQSAQCGCEARSLRRKD